MVCSHWLIPRMIPRPRPTMVIMGSTNMQSTLHCTDTLPLMQLSTFSHFIGFATYIILAVAQCEHTIKTLAFKRGSSVWNLNLMPIEKKNVIWCQKGQVTAKFYCVSIKNLHRKMIHHGQKWHQQKLLTLHVDLWTEKMVNHCVYGTIYITNVVNFLGASRFMYKPFWY